VIRGEPEGRPACRPGEKFATRLCAAGCTTTPRTWSACRLARRRR
jgi:hypothetical protein